MRHRRLAATIALAVGLLMPVTAYAAAPVAGNDQAATTEDTAITVDVLWNDSDPDGDSLHVDSVTQSNGGSVTLTPVAGMVNFTPRQDFNGTATFSYVAADSTGATATAQVMIFVSPVNDPPFAYNRSVSVPEDGSVTILFGAMDPDKERCDLTFLAEPTTAHGQLGPFTNGSCSPNGDFATAVYTPRPNYSGSDTISYVAFDGTAQSQVATISIAVDPIDDAPVAIAGAATTAAGSPVSITLRGFDWETCELTFALITTTPHGKITGPVDASCGAGGPIDPNVDAATIVYTPVTGFSGTDSLTFAVSDGTTLSAPAGVTITVVAPPAIHVGDLDGSTIKGSGTWSASTTIRVDTAGHLPQPGATVRGVWSSGLAGTCTTVANGTCAIGSGSIARKIQTAAFTVTSMSFGSTTYDPSLNHDPDGDSTGTAITIDRP